MNILGINAFHGDAAAALFRNGQLVAAVEEERFNRIKHCAGFPDLAVAHCLRDAGGAAVEHVAISRNPWAHIVHKALFAAANPARWRKAASRLGNSLELCKPRDLGLTGAKIHRVEHHRAHLASAFFVSPFEEAAVVSVDGSGDFASAMWAIGRGNRLKVLGSVLYPHSLGNFYTCFTQYLGFHKYGDEYKMMGLSAYGEPRYAAEIARLIRMREGRLRLDLANLMDVGKDAGMTWSRGEPRQSLIFSPRLVERFGPARAPGSEIEPRHADIAASVQKVLEDNYLALLNHVGRITGQKKVCLAGGVALNCVANGMIRQRTDFADVYVQPASHDAGTALGAALHVQHQVLGLPRSFVMRHVYYGPEYSESEIRAQLEGVGVAYQRLDTPALVAHTAREIAAGKIVGWFQGRMEFGPRALGNRSILADPRRAGMKDILNTRIKHREVFRPFCPSILAEAVDEYFETAYPSPFMVMAFKIKPEKRAIIPAVTHGDGTGRLQTVERDVNPLYWQLIRTFGDLTGVPVLLNTSFNENEPIVNTPREALECFLRTRMDVLAMGPFFVTKAANQRLDACKPFAEMGCRMSAPLLILAQASGNMIAELAEDAGPCAIFGTFHQKPLPVLPPAATLHRATPLSTASTPRRLWSWFRYLVESARWILQQPKDARLLLFSNPPLLPMVGYLLHKFTGRSYSVVVYDIYPDLLVRIGRLRRNGLAARFWWMANRRAYRAAEHVVTLGPCMAETLAPQTAHRPAIVPPWVDTAAVCPVPKERNPVAREYGQVGKLTVMYMGKMGISHDLETMLAAAGRLQGAPGVHFLFIGAGPKWNLVRGAVERLSNATVLPWQSERVPLFHAMAEIAVVSLEAEASGMEAPSRTVFHMAAGSAILAVSSAPNDLAGMVEEHACGCNVALGDVGGFVAAIRRWMENPEELQRHRQAARRAAEREYSRHVNVARMLAVLRGADFSLRRASALPLRESAL